MSEYTINNLLKSKNTLKLPFELREKYRNRIKQEVTISELGRIDFRLPLYLKLRDSQHSSIANDDVRIYNTYSVNRNSADTSNSNENSFNILNTNEIKLPNTIQNGPTCMLVSLCNSIQSLLPDIVIDYAKLMKCLDRSPINISVDEQDNLYVVNMPKPIPAFASKVLNFLFKKTCVPVSTAECEDKCNNLQDLNKSNINADCDETCVNRYIQIDNIEFKKYNTPPLDNKTVCEIINGGFAFPISLDEEMTNLLILKTVLNQEQYNLFMSNNPTKAQIVAQLDALLGGDHSKTEGHSVSLVSCEGPDENGRYIFGIKNSWAISQNKIITTQTPADLSIIKKLDSKLEGSINIWNQIVSFSIKECKPRPKQDPACECAPCKDKVSVNFSGYSLDMLTNPIEEPFKNFLQNTLSQTYNIFLDGEIGGNLSGSTTSTIVVPTFDTYTTTVIVTKDIAGASAGITIAGQNIINGTPTVFSASYTTNTTNSNNPTEGFGGISQGVSGWAYYINNNFTITVS